MPTLFLIIAIVAMAYIVMAGMGSSFGRKTIGGSTGTPRMVIADGRFDGMKVGGVTIDWTKITASAGETTTEGKVIAAGDKYIRYGTVLDIITATGLYAPVDTSVTDGREAMARGQSYILNETVVESELGSNHPPVFDAGTVFWDRVVKDGSNQPTSANILTAFPNLILIRETA